MYVLVLLCNNERIPMLANSTCDCLLSSCYKYLSSLSCDLYLCCTCDCTYVVLVTVLTCTCDRCTCTWYLWYLWIGTCDLTDLQVRLYLWIGFPGIHKYAHKYGSFSVLVTSISQVPAVLVTSTGYKYSVLVTSTWFHVLLAINSTSWERLGSARGVRRNMRFFMFYMRW